MSDWWDDQAGRLQAMGRITEGEKGEQYTAAQARRATVYAREDVILIVSLLSSLNRQVRTVRRLGMVIAIALTVIAIELAWGR